MLEAFPAIAERVPDARLIVAGGNHPMAPGYVESVAAHCQDARVSFTGYLAEDALPELFRSASVLVLPDSSATGASGVAHLGCEYGLPIISADIPDFRGMVEEEDLAFDFYRVGDGQDLAEKIVALLLDSGRQREMAEQNFLAALRMTMPQVVRQYLRSFDLQQRRRALRPIARFRRIPAWEPASAAFCRAAKTASRWSPWT